MPDHIILLVIVLEWNSNKYLILHARQAVGMLNT